MTDDLTAALRSRAGALARERRATARLTVLESVLVDVWKWTNDGHPHLELLLPILNRAESQYKIIAALEALEETGVNA